MHASISALLKKMRHAEAFARACCSDLERRFDAGNAYSVAFIRLGNKAKYAAEVIEGYALRMPTEGTLEPDQVERLIEAQKWFVIGALSVLEYSMSSLLGSAGSRALQDLAANGPFLAFLDKAEATGFIEQNEKGLLEFASRVRNDLIHRNGVSRQSAELDFQDITFKLVQGEMIEGYFGMLADLGTLILYSLPSILETIESHRGKVAYGTVT